MKNFLIFLACIVLFSCSSNQKKDNQSVDKSIGTSSIGTLSKSKQDTINVESCPCRTCNETGKCGYCGGRGSYRCAPCNGIGSINDETHSSCNGTGDISCSGCSGSGNCGTCQGSGSLPCNP